MTDKEKLALAIQAMSKAEDILQLVNDAFQLLKNVRVDSYTSKKMEDISVEIAIKAGEYKVLREQAKQ